MLVNERPPQTLDIIFKKLKEAHPDLALQIALSGISLNKSRVFEQVDCILALATIRELNKNNIQVR